MTARGLQERQSRIAIYFRRFWDQSVLQSHLHHTASSRSKQLVQAHLLMQSHLGSTLYAELHRFQLPSTQEMLFIRSQHEPHRHNSEKCNSSKSLRRKQEKILNQRSANTSLSQHF
jgi:extradiol dioxygenase family protein